MKQSIQVLTVSLFMAAFSLAAGQPRLVVERPFEPVVLRGSILSSAYSYPVNELYLYAWDNATWSWRMMPFQIDERILAPDPNNPEVNRHSYFIPDDGLLDEDDELVFMVRDLGVRAPARAWIDNPESRNFNRIELEVYDPDNGENNAYAYLFRSPTITEAVPSPYAFAYDSTADRVDSRYYAVAMDAKIGLVKDIAIKPPFGSGQDLFDRQKIRATAVLGGGPFSDMRFDKVTESLIKVVPGYRKITPKPVVRLVREVRQTFNLGIADLEEGMTFYVTTRFYPFNGRVAGGSALDEASLKQAMPKWDDPFILFEYLRQSWDLSSNAKGMRYFNKHNSGILVDGTPDIVNLAIDRPIRDWNLVAGSQGALFSLTTLPDTVAESISLYYYDNSTGGTGDPANLRYFDTGEEKGSYGDFGFSMVNAKSLELSFEMYFLPDTINSAAQAQNLADAVERSVWVYSRTVTGVAGWPGNTAPSSFALSHNYPNPFNQETTISFTLTKGERIALDVYDAHGRCVRRITAGFYSGGTYHFSWDGRDDWGIAISSGVYFAQLHGEGRTVRQKLLLLR
ncbi:MAG TPA: FlgD immunoglobulin-like domain containing protein [bacterium]|nr:FlgD immunoglobulin-like domain containing protein [bacterium]HQG45753.1 FlgD immunoglobulin-like domain containing protein [bacterium]HQJ65120.1 FlgD immunoglobulin-like domain containing protein [bacterium]